MMVVTTLGQMLQEEEEGFEEDGAFSRDEAARMVQYLSRRV